LNAPRLRIRAFALADTEALVALWEACGLTRPWNDPRRDIERRRALNDGLFLVGEPGPGDDGHDAGGHDDENPSPHEAAGLVASAMGGYDGHRGWVYYVAVHPAHRGHGHGRRLMGELERRLLARGCPKINLQVRTGNDDVLAFYARLGFSVDATVSLGKRLIADD